ncbi:hypothetical protein P7C73_g2567, partial [Tremellales sp. Uapishka_1]
MEHQRPHLDRGPGAGTNAKQAAPHVEAPRFLRSWEKRRPIWLVEMIAEFWGVFIYTFCGVGATAAFTVTAAAKLTGCGGVLNISIAYGLGIVFAITIAGPVSGGHLSPAYTLAFTLFKGFPARKALQYIVAQLLGGFVAVLCVYGQYKQEIDEITDAILAATMGNTAISDPLIFSPFGPAGILAIYPAPGQLLRYVFLNELMITIVLAIIVFTVIDSTNAFVSISSGPWIIGAAYLAIIVAFANDTAALNTARDFGGRLACMAIFGRGAFNSNKSYAALACLTNILGTLLGAAIQVFWLSDHRRPVITQFPGNARTHAANPSASEDGIVSGPNHSTNGFSEKNANHSAPEHNEYHPQVHPQVHSM